ncbi:MAG: UPF0149 family protein [Candidatus Thiodiazotropha sp.]
MTNLDIPLDEDEIDRLEQFLMNRIDEEVLTDEIDEGIFDVSTLDGFFTAVVSGPVPIPPSVWLPKVWGDFEPEWTSAEAFSEIFTLMVRHMNGISQILMEFPEDFEPLFDIGIHEETSQMIVDEWCEGYQRGVELSFEQWMSGGEEIIALLEPILAFTETTEWRGHDYGADEVEEAHQLIGHNVKEIHAYWLTKRDDIPPPDPPMIRHEPNVGRNDPCPCGSGKKYKKCCLH